MGAQTWWLPDAWCLAASPALDSTGVLELIIKSNVSPVPDTVQLLSVRVTSSLNGLSQARLVIADGDSFVPGARIDIEAGNGCGSKPIFSGIVVKHGLRIGAGNDVRLYVECRGAATVPPPDQGAEPVLSVTHGVDLLSFEAEIDARASSSQFSQAGAASAPVRGRLSFQGSALATPGCWIELKGVGARFSGNVLVNLVEHVIEDGNWRTDLGFGPAADDDVEVAIKDDATSIVLKDQNGALLGVAGGSRAGGEGR